MPHLRRVRQVQQELEEKETSGRQGWLAFHILIMISNHCQPQLIITIVNHYIAIIKWLIAIYSLKARPETIMINSYHPETRKNIIGHWFITAF